MTPISTSLPKPSELTAVIHLKMTATDLKFLDSEAARMLKAAGGGRFSRADALRAILRKAREKSDR